ncbi:MAG: DUF2807 domain-containing protein [Bacteroidota bacterium]
MNRTVQPDSVFQQIRQLPPELSRADVQDIIQQLPLLSPPRAPWYFFISLNTIVMSIIGIGLVVVWSIFYLITPTTNTAATSQQLEIINNNKNTAIVIQLTDNQNDSDDENTESSVVQTMIHTLDDEVVRLETATTLQPIETSFQPISITHHQQRLTGQWGDLACEIHIQFDGNPTHFKSQLLQEMERDGLIRDRKERMRCHFAPNGMIVNDKIVSKAIREKYKMLLAKHEVFPCDRRIIETTDDYIAIGDVAAEGFHGISAGDVDKLVLADITFSTPLSEIKILPIQETSPLPSVSVPFHTIKVSGPAEVYLTDQYDGIVSVEAGKENISTKNENGILTIRAETTIRENKVRLFTSSDQLRYIELSQGAVLKTQERVRIKTEKLMVKVAEESMAHIDIVVGELTAIMAGGILNADGVTKLLRIIDEDPEQKGELKDIDLYVKEEVADESSQYSCYSTLALSAQQLEKLKAELGDLVIQNQAQLQNLDFPIRLHFRNGQWRVNEQVLTETQATPFVQLLSTHEIPTCEDRMVLLDKRFIAAGDITESRFKGIALGNKLTITSRYGRIDMKSNRAHNQIKTGWGSKIKLVKRGF